MIRSLIFVRSVCTCTQERLKNITEASTVYPRSAFDRIGVMRTSDAVNESLAIIRLAKNRCHHPRGFGVVRIDPILFPLDIRVAGSDVHASIQWDGGTSNVA